MLDPFFQVFKFPNDHRSWHKQRDYVSLIEELNENEKSDLINALNFLEDELGEHFLKSTNFNHPIQQKVTNHAKWQQLELIRIATLLKQLKTFECNYDKLKRILINTKKAKTEAMSFIDIAESYLKQNFRVYFLNETNTGKIPDIQITNPSNNDIFFIEVSSIKSLGTSIEESGYIFIIDLFGSKAPCFPYSGKQKRVIERSEYNNVRKIVLDAKKNVAEKGEVIFYSDDKLEFYLAPFEKANDLNEICKKKGIQPWCIIGLSVDYDEIEKVIKSNKIKEKAKQIPANVNGIIYLKINPLFFMMIADLKGKVKRLENYLSTYTNIIGVVFQSEILTESKTGVWEIDNHIFRIKVYEGALCQYSLFVLNNNCSLTIEDSTFNGILETLR